MESHLTGGVRVHPQSKLVISMAIVSAVGYLFLLFLAVLRKQDFGGANSLSSITVFGLAACGAAIVVEWTLVGLPRTATLAGLGLIMLILCISLAGRINFPIALTLLYGGGSGILAFAFVALIISLGFLDARRHRPQSAMIRFVCGGASGVALMAYLVQLLVILADDGFDSSGLGYVFRGGDVIMKIYAWVMILAVLAILVVGLTAAVRTSGAEELARVGFGLSRFIFWLVVTVVLIRLVLQISSRSVGPFILDFLVAVVGGLGPLACAAFLLIGSLRDGLVSIQSGSLKRAMRAPEARFRMATETEAPLPARDLKVAGDIESQLRKLKQWHEEGLISTEDYQRKKNQLLSGGG